MNYYLVADLQETDGKDSSKKRRESRQGQHLGKKIGDNARFFIYALSSERIEEYPPDTMVISEKGDEMTMAEFRAEVLTKARDLKAELVGVSFS